MSEKKGVFGSQSKAQEKQYEREARLQYDPEIVKESNKKWNDYTKSQQEFIKEDGNRIYRDIVTQIEAGKEANDSEVQAILVEWHDHIRHFYEPTTAFAKSSGD